eukprot:3158295-Rhodomonas_salina.1
MQGARDRARSWVRGHRLGGAKQALRGWSCGAAGQRLGGCGGLGRALPSVEAVCGAAQDPHARAG